MSSLRVLHQAYLRNGAWGGMEKSFAAFLAATRDDAQIDNFVIENLRGVAAPLQRAFEHLAAPAREVRRWRGLPLPSSPAALRRGHRRSAAAEWRINRVINWNQVGDAQPARLARALAARSLYWERGAAWFTGVPKPDPDFRSSYDLYLANSEASRQMLLQLWKVRGEIRVCTPGLAMPDAPAAPRQLDPSRPLRLGFAARLRAFKGGVLAVHALHALHRRGVRAELWVAGEGPDRAAMQQQALALGCAQHLRFLGWVASMDAFFADIDLLLHPALREPYGLSCAEALVRGVPVIASQVDGLPEVIAPGVDGLCVPASMPLERFARFGGNRADVYPRVYRPDAGSVGEPGFAAPEALADAVQQLGGDAARYAAFSAAGCAAAQQRFSYDAHLARLRQLLMLAGEETAEAGAPGRLARAHAP